jgi:hypothetical protein
MPAGQQYEARLDKTLLPMITLEDVNARAALFTHTNSAVFKSVEHRHVQMPPLPPPPPGGGCTHVAADSYQACIRRRLCLL